MLYPPTLPAAKTRAERFDAMVLEAPIEQRWGAELTDLDLAVDDVPRWTTSARTRSCGTRGARRRRSSAGPSAGSTRKGVARRIVLYRRPLEAQGLRRRRIWRSLLHEVLVEQVAEYLNIEPDAVDGVEG